MENITTNMPQYPDFGALLESIKENGRRIDERDERFRKEQAERYARWETEQAERYARWEMERKEFDARWEAERKEFNRRMEESNTKLDKISEDTNKAIKDMKNVFTTQWGRLVEALSKPAALALFKKEGIEIDRVFEDVRKIKKDGQDVMEIDVALCDTTTAVIVEVKSYCDNHDINHFLSQMEHCKEWYPDFADKKLLVAVAAISYAPGTEAYAQRLGLYVLKLTGEETFTMEVPQNPLAF
ncbi:MAG: hypothetical protein IKP54_11275 [Bacteroidales bacterium]|nr:hypothetical protein [Bacteroidales bacterium]